MLRTYQLILFIILSIVVSDNTHAIREANPDLFPLEYPTLTALRETIIPPADRYDLARRLFGVSAIPATAENPAILRIGETRTFSLSREPVQNVPARITTELLAIGEHIYVWVETGAAVSRESARQFARSFDTQVYHQVRELMGNEANPGVDGDARIYAVFARRLEPGVAAYYTSHHAFPKEIVPNSNERDMMFFNLEALGNELSRPRVISVTAHEFQHMIRQNVDLNESAWVDEGLSVFVENYLELNDSRALALSFLGAPQIQLNAWPHTRNIAPHYGASYLFTTYFYEQYGEEGIKALSAKPADGLAGFDQVIKTLGGDGVDEFFADWAMANYLQRPETGYGYRTISMLAGALPTTTIMQYPHTTAGESLQYASDYYVLTNLEGIERLEITLEAADSVALLPISATSGAFFWYSNKADESNTTLTRAFDLSSLSAATLEYSVWYDLETGWDYAYVMVSVDEGNTWEILSTPHTTIENPNDKAYGAGYNGQSGGWIRESISLDDYAGKEALIRFEMITDDATTQPGIVIDDIRIPELGYSDNFETYDDTWESRGWIHTDNRLPQQVWIQAAQQVDDEIILARWRATGRDSWQLELAESAQEVILAISPFAPVTTVPMRYELSVTADGR